MPLVTKRISFGRNNTLELEKKRERRKRKTTTKKENIQLKGQRNKFTESRSDRKRHMKLLFTIKCSMSLNEFKTVRGPQLVHSC